VFIGDSDDEALFPFQQHTGSYSFNKMTPSGAEH